MLSESVIPKGMKNSHSDVVSLDLLPPITRMETGIADFALLRIYRSRSACLLSPSRKISRRLADHGIQESTGRDSATTSARGKIVPNMSRVIPFTFLLCLGVFCPMAFTQAVAPPQDRQQKIIFFRLRASIESGLGRSAPAAADMEAASKLAPENLDLQVAASLARLEAQLESHHNPAPVLARLRGFTLTPAQQLDVRLHTAEILSRANLFQEAAKELEDASLLAPDRADTYFNLALARYRSGEWDNAYTSAERAKHLQDTGSVESLLGDIQEKRGDALAAVHSYQAAVSLEPDVEEHRLVLATELLKHQTFDAAVVVLEQARALFPQSVRLAVLLGLTYYFVDRSADSIRTPKTLRDALLLKTLLRSLRMR